MAKSKGAIKEPMTWRRTEGGLAPSSERAERALKRLEIGEECVVDLRIPRNLKHTRKFFSLLRIVQDNSEDFASVEAVLLAICAALGRGEWVTIPKATRPLFVRESIAFESMDQDEFDRFYRDAVQVVLSYFLPGLDADQLEAIAIGY